MTTPALTHRPYRAIRRNAHRVHASIARSCYRITAPTLDDGFVGRRIADRFEASEHTVAVGPEAIESYCLRLMGDALEHGACLRETSPRHGSVGIFHYVLRVHSNRWYEIDA